MKIRGALNDIVAAQLVFEKSLNDLQRLISIPEKECRRVSIEEVELELIVRSVSIELVDPKKRKAK